jgi:hypothetical protein
MSDRTIPLWVKYGEDWREYVLRNVGIYPQYNTEDRNLKQPINHVVTQSFSVEQYVSSSRSQLLSSKYT